MIGQDQIFKAKSFLKVYKDAFKCVEQVAIKSSHEKYVREFYRKLDLSASQKEIKFDKDGNITKGPALGYFSRLYTLYE
jgi:phage/plasmid-associated DNA primase